MADRAGGGTRPPLTGIIAGALVAVGVLLWMFVSKAFLFVAALGAFGPGILRELGWLRDHDEFQRESAHRAGYHAYLAGGLAAALVVSAAPWPRLGLDSSPEWIRFILVVLWLSWLFSAMLAYWGAQKTAARVLRTFGSFWAVFVLASLVGDFHMPATAQELFLGLLGVLVGIGVVAPFFVLAWTARRWPRSTGLALLGVSLIFVVVFGWNRHTPLSTTYLTMTLLIGPLAVSALGLLRERSSEAEDEGPTDVPSSASRVSG